ncbi:MAG: FUSC family protein [Nibricoccus sp.]
MKRLPPPETLIHQWLQNPHASTVAAFTIAGVFIGIAGWFIQRNLRHNEPGLRAPLALPFALIISAAGVFGAWRLPSPYGLIAGIAICALAALLFYYADHRRWVRHPAGKIVADRWQIVVAFAGFRWTRDKANRHFFFSGDTGSGKTSGMNGLLAALFRRNPTLGGVIMANKGDEWFYLEWLAKKYGRTQDVIRLRPRLVGETGKPLHRLNVTGDARLPFTTRARILVDTAAALNPKDEKSFFKVKGAAHIGRAFELLADIGRPVTATNAYDLLTSEKELKDALGKLTELDPSERRIRLADTFEQTYLKHEAKEQRAGEIGTSQNYLEYLGTPEIAEIFSSNEPDTCSIADVDRGKIFCIDVPQDYTTERQYIFTVAKLLLYRHALRRYALPPYQKYALNQLIFVGDEFQNAITASHDGTSDFNVIDRLRDCMLMLVISAQAFESLIPPQTKEQAEVFALNLKNLFMYRAASELDALRCANALGKHWVERASRTVHQDHTAHTYQRMEEFLIKPHEFRNLPDHVAVVRHCTNGFRKVNLRPS